MISLPPKIAPVDPPSRHISAGHLALTLVLFATLILLPTTSRGAIIAGTDFTGRTIAGLIVSDITWTTLGVLDPGDLAVIDAPAGLFDTANAQGHFAPDRNTENEGPWNVNVPLVVDAGFVSVTLESIDLDWQHFNNSGAFQSAATFRDIDWTVTVTGSSSGLLDTLTASISAPSGIETLTFGSPLVLSGAETYLLNVNATAGSNSGGNNTGLDAITINGSALAAPPVPEPSTYVLFALVLLAGAGFLRKRHV